MKKFLAIIALFMAGTGVAEAGRDFTIESNLGPATSATNVVIAAAGSGKKNCLEDVSVISDAAYTFYVLNGNATFYQLTMGANTGLVKSWGPEHPLCTANNTAMEIKVSAGTFNINYQGFVGR